MNEAQVLLLFKHYTAIAKAYAYAYEPESESESSTESEHEADTIKVIWHDRSGLIISESSVPARGTADSDRVYEVYAPDSDTDLTYQSRGSVTPGTHSLFAVGDMLLYNKAVSQPDNTVQLVPTFKIRYYSKTPERFKNYVENTVRLFSQQSSNVY